MASMWRLCTAPAPRLGGASAARLRRTRAPTPTGQPQILTCGHRAAAEPRRRVHRHLRRPCAHGWAPPGRGTRDAAGTFGRACAGITPAAAGAPAAGHAADLGAWCALYINLARRGDRRRQLLRTLSLANGELLGRVERVDAVDGRQLKFSCRELEKVVEEEALRKARRALEHNAHTIIYQGRSLVHFDDHLTPGGIACAMSHRLALERLAAHPTAEWALILEDDIRALVPRVETAIGRILCQVPRDWDAVFLGYHDGQGHLHPCAWETLEPDARGADVLVEPLHAGLYGLYAWMVTKGAAQLLLDNAFPVHSQVDHALSSWLAQKRGRCFKVGANSLLFYSHGSEEGDSDIQTMASLDEVTREGESLHDVVFDQWMVLNTESSLADWAGEDIDDDLPDDGSGAGAGRGWEALPEEGSAHPAGLAHAGGYDALPAAAPDGDGGGGQHWDTPAYADGGGFAHRDWEDEAHSWWQGDYTPPACDSSAPECVPSVAEGDFNLDSDFAAPCELDADSRGIGDADRDKLLELLNTPRPRYPSYFLELGFEEHVPHSEHDGK
mmetsp:Transcript_124883/g.353475  ORF Transcript_124883/g.353475 Transcript_124883/m.353475 type:complete len:556 (+) Transcript_124883:91-1758(+)